MTGDVVLETERLVLRPLSLNDVDDLLEYHSRPEIVQYIPWPERTRDQVIEVIEKTLAAGNTGLVNDGDYLLFGWELKETGKVIGQSNIKLNSLNDGNGEIGWVAHQDFQRQGYAFEATQALLKYAFKNFPLRRIVADIDTRNPASARLAEKLGMRREAEFIEIEFFKGALCSMWQFAILSREFNAH